MVDSGSDRADEFADRSAREPGSERTVERESPRETRPSSGTPQDAGPDLRQALEQSEAVDVLKRPDVQGQIKSGVAYFAVVGFGLGATGFLTLTQITNAISGGGSGAVSGFAAGVVLLIAFVTVIIVGPLVAAVVTSRQTGSIDLRGTDMYLVGFVSSYVGYIVMVFVAALLMSLGFPSGGSSPNLGRLILPLLVTGIPSGLVGAATGFVEEQFPLQRMGSYQRTGDTSG